MFLFSKANQTENQPVILKKKTTLKLGTTTTNNNNTIDQYECTTPLELDSNNKRLDLNINTVAQLNSTPHPLPRLDWYIDLDFNSL